MKRPILFLFVVGSILCLSPAHAFAASFGGFIDASAARGDSKWDSDLHSMSLGSQATSLGFVLDTAPTNESAFNYRLNVGLSSLELDEDSYGRTYESKGVYAENIFGFAFIKKPAFRWWLGPLVRIGFYSGHVDKGGQKIDIDMVEVGIGVSSGMNFKLSDNVILAPSIGLKSTSDYYGTGKAAGYANEDFEVSSISVSFNLALLF